MEAVLSDSRAKDTFAPDLHIEISEDDFCVMGQALIVYVFEFSLEGILTHIHPNYVDVIEFCPDADSIYYFGHRSEPRARWRSFLLTSLPTWQL